MNLMNSQFKLAALDSFEPTPNSCQKRHSFGPSFKNQVRPSIAIQDVPTARNLVIYNGERQGHSSAQNQSLWRSQMMGQPNFHTDLRSETML